MRSRPLRAVTGSAAEGAGGGMGAGASSNRDLHVSRLSALEEKCKHLQVNKGQKNLTDWDVAQVTLFSFPDF